MKRLLWGVVLCLLLPLGAQAQNADWTIIYYSAADTDLEEFMIGDLMEMQIVGSTDDVNIVVEMDRVEGYDEANGSWTDTRRFLVQAGDPDKLSYGDFQMDRDSFIESIEDIDPEEFGISQEDFDAELDALRDISDEEFEAYMLDGGAPVVGADPQGLQQESIESIGEAEMGDPDHLAEFTTWAIENYPAEHYMLILSDHGGGWSGVAFDESSGGDALTLRDLDIALAQVIEKTGLEKLDLVAFDACLMGQLEVYNVLAPYARYTIAAEEPIPGAGWEYVSPFQALVDEPSMDTPEFAELVIDSYMSYYTDVIRGYPTYDLHLVDLERIDAVNEALENFIALIAEDPDEHIEAIGYAHSEAQGFSQDDRDAAAYFSSVDLADFMKKMKRYTDDDAVADAADAVIDAVKDAVLYSGASEELPGANGVAIYFPANVDDYELGDNHEVYPEQAGDVMASWVGFLDVFHGTAETVYAPSKTGLSIDITQVVPSDHSASIYDQPIIIFDTDGTGIVDIQFYASLVLEDGLSVIVDSAGLESAEYNEDGEQLPPFPEGPTTSQFLWNVESPVVVDAAGNSELVTLVSNKDNPDVSTVSGIYRSRDGEEESEAYIIFDLATQTMQSVFGIQAGLVGQALGEINIEEGDTFEPYYLVLTEEGKIVRDPSGTRLVFSEEPFTYAFYPSPNGDYELTIWLEDIAGNIVQDSETFSIDNTGLDENWRGLQDIDSGISFLYPWSWDNVGTRLYDDGSYKLEIQSPEGTQFIGVDIFDEEFGVTSLDDVVDKGIEYIESYGEAGEAENVSAGYKGREYDVVILPYTYVSDDDQDRMGWLILAYVDFNELGYQIDVDVRVEDESEGQRLLVYILNTLAFEEPTVIGD